VFSYFAWLWPGTLPQCAKVAFLSHDNKISLQHCTHVQRCRGGGGGHRGCTTIKSAASSQRTAWHQVYAWSAMPKTRPSLVIKWMKTVLKCTIPKFNETYTWRSPLF
jgi:hypothetical protein